METTEPDELLDPELSPEQLFIVFIMKMELGFLTLKISVSIAVAPERAYKIC